MNLVQVQPDRLSEYSAVMEKHAGHFFQSPQWAAFKQNEWSIKHFFIQKDDNIIGGTALYQRAIPLLNKPYIYIPGGPVFVNGNDPKIWAGFTQMIRQYAARVGAVFVKVDPPLCRETYSGIFTELGYIPQKSLSQGFGGYTLSSTIICDISGSYDEVFNRIPRKTRYYIRVPGQKGVEFSHLGQKGLDVFMDIIDDTSKRANFESRPAQYYQKLMEAFGKQAEITAAYYEGIPIAAGLTIAYGRCAWSFSAGQSSEYKHLQTHYALNWEKIRWAKEMGATSFDLYGIPIDRDEGNPLMGLFSFKKRFGGRILDVVGECDLPINTVLYKIWRIMVKLNRIRRKVI